MANLKTDIAFEVVTGDASRVEGPIAPGLGGKITVITGKTADIITVKNWNASANYDYFFFPQWFWYANSLFEHDELGDLDLRSTLGTGIGYQFFESDRVNLSISAGPAYVDENYISAPDDSFTAVQWRIEYDQHFFKGLFQLFHDSNGYRAIEASEQWVVNTRQGIRFPIYKGITTTVQYSYDYNSNPSPEARADYDSSLSVLLGYEFKN